ncbi:hypothetical protein [Nonomuraea sp. B19D2]|uniref:hypothetical protein n=1 Tax=Nonomuraea sp. B19D2 TaxID=3159561 RepID=UPI0032DB6517
MFQQFGGLHSLYAAPGPYPRSGIDADHGDDRSDPFEGRQAIASQHVVQGRVRQVWQSQLFRPEAHLPQRQTTAPDQQKVQLDHELGGGPNI